MVLVLRNSTTENLGYLEKSLSANLISFRYFDTKYLEDNWKSLLNTNSFEGLIILGGPQGVYEEHIYPYLKYEKQVIEEFLKSEKPILGICLGSQLIANVLGARVYKGDRGPEIGWYDVQITGDGLKDKVLSKYSPSFKVLQIHQDTFDLPKGTVRIATSEKYLNQAFRYSKKVYGIQFHTEITKEEFVNISKTLNIKESEKEYIIKVFDENFEKIKTLNDDIIWSLFIEKW
ncbi:MAG: type 1 glutamine amidotransferase [Brevinematia bacterium]